MIRFKLYEKDLKILSKCDDCINLKECIVEDPTDTLFSFITIHCKNYKNKEEGEENL